ncbi:hypothetical protein [uncultured Winogradskyella sp.]|uniref:hypothetical protein n=1 Tax=uncultured Winogradskyella sp. TaxID=395353 RepID=UPI00260AB47F|nr:hypothetical protein [uncultured Winogradskyella sp.]
MKNRFITAFILFATINLALAQNWMTDLTIAQRLAQVQNKMVLMVWEEATTYQYSVFVNDSKGRTIVVNSLFDDEVISPLIWDYFVPVIVREEAYADLYLKIKGKRPQSYIDKFNDDSIKIMDINGNIINIDPYTEGPQNISRIIQRYAINTELIENELAGYKKEKTFYTAYYLASKYLDLAIHLKKNVRSAIIDLSKIYLNEAKEFAKSEADSETLLQRCDLLEIQEVLINRKPKRVLRLLKRMEKQGIAERNESFAAFLYFSSYITLNEPDKAEKWKSKVSAVNLKKAWKIINLIS